MKVTFNFKVPALNLAGYKKVLDDHMKDVITRAAIDWLEAVALKIPLWSGASRATFLKLAQEAGYNLNMSPQRWGHSRVGQGLSESTGHVITQADRGVYTFIYGTTLPWLVWNESHDANTDPDPTKWPGTELLQPGPYGFQEIGVASFKKFAESVRLPNVSPFITSR